MGPRGITPACYPLKQRPIGEFVQMLRGFGAARNHGFMVRSHPTVTLRQSIGRQAEPSEALCHGPLTGYPSPCEGAQNSRGRPRRCARPPRAEVRDV